MLESFFSGDGTNYFQSIHYDVTSNYDIASINNNVAITYDVASTYNVASMIMRPLLVVKIGYLIGYWLLNSCYMIFSNFNTLLKSYSNHFV